MNADCHLLHSIIFTRTGDGTDLSLNWFAQHSDDNSSKDEEMELKISKEINEVLGKTNMNDPDADIVLTEYLSDREEAG